MAKEVKDNLEYCSGSHSQHLCYIVSQGFHISDEQEYKALVKKPRFKCQHCGRVANRDQNLCEPVKM
jgi:hypothetical protein